MVVRAYADDTAVITNDIHRDGPIIANNFDELEALSGLRLNIDKTVLIPLFMADRNELRQQLQKTIQGWTGLRSNSQASS